MAKIHPVYQPAEDSFLLERLVKRFASGAVLDMGTGSGILARAAYSLPKVKSVLAVDLNADALKVAKKSITPKCSKKITFLKSDLFSEINLSSLFETIIYNPPYLPDDGFPPDPALIGGKHGYESIVAFLEQAPRYLTPQGKILLLVSSLSGLAKIKEALGRELLEIVHEEKHAFDFEYLLAWTISKQKIRQQIEKKGVTSLHFTAQGKRGIVYRGVYRSKAVAVKVDHPKSLSVGTLLREGKMLKKVASLGIAPQFILASRSCIVMEWIEGERILPALRKMSARQAKIFLGRLVDVCVKLDTMEIAKEEMHHPWKHVLIERKGTIRFIDFERAHYIKSCHRNVTQCLQMVRSIAPELQKKKISIDNKVLLGAAQEYAFGKLSGRKVAKRIGF